MSALYTAGFIISYAIFSVFAWRNLENDTLRNDPVERLMFTIILSAMGAMIWPLSITTAAAVYVNENVLEQG